MNRWRALRESLGLSPAEWAKALSVNDRTIERWENGSTEPTTLAADVLRGIEQAINEGVDPKRAGRLIALGIGALICYALIARCKAR